MILSIMAELCGDSGAATPSILFFLEFIFYIFLYIF